MSLNTVHVRVFYAVKLIHGSKQDVEEIFGPHRDEVTGRGENYIMRSLTICTPHPLFCG
jgi:hypothetical protein